MAARSNLSSTKRTVAALRRGSRLGPVHAALVRLAETTAAALDKAAEGGEKGYAIAQVARVHLLSVEALLALFDSDRLDPSLRLSPACRPPRW